MIRILLALALCTILISCSMYQSDKSMEQEIVVPETEEPVIPKITYEDKSDSSEVSLKGTIVSYDGNEISSATLMFMQSGPLVEVQVSKDGKLEVDDVEAGTYLLGIQTSGYSSFYIKNLSIFDDKITVLDTITVQKRKISKTRTAKPIIYLYPEAETKVEVKLDYAGKLTHTYPKYKAGWKVTAHPDGTLFDEAGKEYYALYWEGIPQNEFTIAEGFVVPGEQTIEFLEEKLALLGLNRKEANEFIIYWLPKLESNSYNLIHFSSTEYEKMAKLTITPTPDTLIRVMMFFKPLTKPVEIKKQDLSKLKKDRKGFTVVEWGGTEFK